ncbi:carbohydrate-binding module family 21 protein [Chaetomium strumarium]|uniref:Carbohydrate-binding module family 21 protein n=1 Tax=Chaetomium strumarium TaxID=1170767 RepID=A0AAJ0GMK6_9PEZI|nr:carbohydrate-binding module family 21 protein [Chaetomium strumarium]
MPYTPPSRSPASSGPPSPEGSRRPSFHQPQNTSSRPVLPRSSSYLTKHRRTPSAAQSRASHPSPNATSEDLKSLVTSSSVRQSPPPILGDQGMPSGAIISPPASDDDDLPDVRGRGIENLKELRDAVSQIPQQRSGLLTDDDTLPLSPSEPSAAAEGMRHSFSTASLGELANRVPRRFTHMRSNTEPHISISKSSSSSATGSEEDSDEEGQRKPQMVRKKSGELVRPALRPASRRRPSSMPGTPTFSKAVHFDSQLEHVRHFLQVDRPLAVSAGSSPVDNYESDTEYPFSSGERPSARSPPFEWDIVMSNFPVETPVRKAQPVRLERVWLSNDQKSLVGSIAVANLAFQKLVVCRFTLDYWKTTSEVAAEYVSEIRGVDTPYSQDRFNFTIKLSDLANLESKTLYFCIRYNVNGQEYWDNNNGINFQSGKRGAIGAASRQLNGLPKSNRRPSLPASQRSKPTPISSDEFGDSQRPSFNASIHEFLGESGTSGLRLKGTRSTGDLPSDNLSKGLSGPSGQFALRYDFGQSLSRAIQGAKNEMAANPDVLYMKPWKAMGSPTPTKADTTDKSERLTTAKAESATVGPATATSPADSPDASISSASYEEIVNKWCFYGSKQKSAEPRGVLPNAGQHEGPDDASSSTASYEGSPVQTGNYYHTHSGIQHHTLRPHDPSSYFVQSPIFKAMGASPAESPLGKISPQHAGITLGGQGGAGDFTPVSSASASPHDYLYQRVHDRFPFHRSDSYTPAAIRG